MATVSIPLQDCPWAGESSGAYKLLLVDPQTPGDWKGFKLTRRFRRAQYEIEVNNPKGLNIGVKSMLVDGKRIDANVIPSFGDGKTHQVEVGFGS
jgi:cellobiose phosphorylase